MNPVYFFAHFFFFFPGMIQPLGSEKMQLVLFKISSLKTQGRQNNLYLLLVVFEKYLEGFGPQPKERK